MEGGGLTTCAWAIAVTTTPLAVPGAAMEAGHSTEKEQVLSLTTFDCGTSIGVLVGFDASEESVFDCSSDSLECPLFDTVAQRRS